MASPDSVQMVEDDTEGIWRSPTNRVHALGLGVALIMIGVSSMAFGSQAIVERAAYGYVGYGIWCGFIFICCGCLAIYYAKKPTKDNVSAALVISMVTLLFSFAQMSLAGLALYYNISVSGTSSCSGLCPSPAFPYCTAWTNTYTCVGADGLVAEKFCDSLLMFFGCLAFFFTTALGVTFSGCMMDQSSHSVAPEPTRPSTPPGNINPVPLGYQKNVVQTPQVYLTLGETNTLAYQRQVLDSPRVTSGIREVPVRIVPNPPPPPPVEEVDTKSKGAAPVLIPLV